MRLSGKKEYVFQRQPYAGAICKLKRRNGQDGIGRSEQ
jgi:hypothetical protein